VTALIGSSQTCSLTAPWVYDRTKLLENRAPQSLAFTCQYIKDNGLGGIMMYFLESDHSSTMLPNAATGMG